MVYKNQRWTLKRTTSTFAIVCKFSYLYGSRGVGLGVGLGVGRVARLETVCVLWYRCRDYKEEERQDLR